MSTTSSKGAINAEAEFNAEVLNISDYLSPIRVRLRKAFQSAVEEATEELQARNDRLRQEWTPIEMLDRKEMQFVLTYKDGEMRLYLWNPNGYWEYPNPMGAKVPDWFKPTHFMELPEAPTMLQ